MTADAQSVAGITPDQLNAPQSPDAVPDADIQRQKIALANQHAKKAEADAKAAKRRADELEQQLKALTEQVQQDQTASYQEQGKFKELWEQSQKTIAGLKAELESERAAKESVASEAAQERLKNQAIAVIDQAGALSPDQLFDLLQTQNGVRRGEDGNVEVIVAGAAINLTDHIQNLKNTAESGWQHHFGASGARGMGTANSSTVAPGMTNPFRKETYNFTQQMMMRTQNPDLAAALCGVE